MTYNKFVDDLQRGMTDADRARLRALSGAVAALRPVGQVHSTGLWHTDGPVDPPSAATRAHWVAWLALSPFGRAAGLELRARFVGDHVLPLLPGSNGNVWVGLEQALGVCQPHLEFLSVTGAMKVYRGSYNYGVKPYPEDLVYSDDGHSLPATLGRLGVLLGARPPRVLSSR